MRPGSTWKVTVFLSGAATGTPTAKVLHNGVLDAGITVTVAAGADANSWKLSAPIPSSGYAVDDTIEFVMTSTISGVTQTAAVARTYIEPAFLIADGTCQAGSDANTIKFGAADAIANALSGTVNRFVEIVAGTGMGQVAAVASVAGASGSKTGTLATGWTWVTPPTTSSEYAWRDAVPSGSGSGVTLSQINTALASGIVTLAPTGLDSIVIETNYNLKQATKLILLFAANRIVGTSTSIVTLGGSGLPAPTVGTNTTLTATMSGTDRYTINAIVVSAA
jgi:hypothetical protein